MYENFIGNQPVFFMFYNMKKKKCLNIKYKYKSKISL